MEVFEIQEKTATSVIFKINDLYFFKHGASYCPTTNLNLDDHPSSPCVISETVINEVVALADAHAAYIAAKERYESLQAEFPHTEANRMFLSIAGGEASRGDFREGVRRLKQWIADVFDEHCIGATYREWNVGQYTHYVRIQFDAAHAPEMYLFKPAIVSCYERTHYEIIDYALFEKYGVVYGARHPQKLPFFASITFRTVV